jgi:hypothetical protein
MIKATLIFYKYHNVFNSVEAVRNTGGRRAKDYELEKITKQMMKGMPEKYRNSLLKPAAEMEVDEEDGVEGSSS